MNLTNIAVLDSPIQVQPVIVTREDVIDSPKKRCIHYGLQSGMSMSSSWGYTWVWPDKLATNPSPLSPDAELFCSLYSSLLSYFFL